MVFLTRKSKLEAGRDVCYSAGMPSMAFAAHLSKQAGDKHLLTIVNG